MVVVQERSLMEVDAERLPLTPGQLAEYLELPREDRGLLSAEVITRWTADLAEDDLSLAEVAEMERRRQANLRTIRQGIELTDVEFKLMRYLARAKGKVRTYVQIANHLWGSSERPIKGWDLRSQDGYASPYVRHIWVIVSEIRRKIEIDPARPQHLATRRGIGYTWHDAPPSLDDGVDYQQMAREHEALRVEVRYELGGDIGSLPIPSGARHPMLGPNHPAYEEALEGDVTHRRSEPHNRST